MNPTRLGLMVLGLVLAGTIAARAEARLYGRVSAGASNTDKLSALSANPGDVLRGSSGKSAVVEGAVGFGSDLTLFGFRAEAAVTARPGLKFSANGLVKSVPTTASLKGQQYAAMGNVYLDLPVPFLVKPYVGGGAGVAHTTIDGSSTNFAWNVMAGVGIKLLPLTDVDLMVRHFDAGHVSGALRPASATSTLSYSSTLGANEALLGVRVGF